MGHVSMFSKWYSLGLWASSFCKLQFCTSEFSFRVWVILVVVFPLDVSICFSLCHQHFVLFTLFLIAL